MANGSGDPFGRFYRDNLRALRAYVARLLPGASDAEDIASQVFTRVYEIRTDRAAVPPRAYLYAAARNLVRNHARHARVRNEPDDPQAEIELLADAAPDAERMLLARERVAQLQQAYAALSPLRRQVIYLRKIERLSIKDIADRMELSVSAVEKHIRHGLRACQAHLDALDRMEEEREAVTAAPPASSPSPSPAGSTGHD